MLPAYLIGMVLAGTVGKDHARGRRLRALTFGLLTLFYFIRAGSFVSIPALYCRTGRIIDQGQHSALVATVIASAAIPTVIANAFYLPHHLLPKAGPEKLPIEQGGGTPPRRVTWKTE